MVFQTNINFTLKKNYKSDTFTSENSFSNYDMDFVTTIP